ncbi:MAG: hypothetical protein ABSG91_03730 [Syntrophobacteraceae bacterium]
MSFLGNYVNAKVTEATLSRDMIRQYVIILFKRPDFPEQLFISLGDSSVVSRGDVVWMNIDCEHPYDWLPLPRIDDLVLNLPSKERFLQELGVDRLEDVSLEAETLFWNSFAFEFAKSAAGVRLDWK